MKSEATSSIHEPFESRCKTALERAICCIAVSLPARFIWRLWSVRPPP